MPIISSNDTQIQWFKSSFQTTVYNLLVSRMTKINKTDEMLFKLFYQANIQSQQQMNFCFFVNYMGNTTHSLLFRSNL